MPYHLATPAIICFQTNGPNTKKQKNPLRPLKNKIPLRPLKNKILFGFYEFHFRKPNSYHPASKVANRGAVRFQHEKG